MARRRADPTIAFALLSLGSAFGVAAAWKAREANTPRMAAYNADAVCGTTLEQLAASKSCTVERATVASTWVRSNRGSRYYRAAIRASDNVDSVELKGTGRREAWQSLSVGAPVTVERFTDPDPAAKRHVSALRLAGRRVPTGWSPAYRARDSLAGMIGLSLVTVIFTIAWGVSLRARRVRQEQA